MYVYSFFRFFCHIGHCRVLSRVPCVIVHSVVSNSLRPHGLQHSKASLSSTISRSLLKLISIESVMPSNHLIRCYPLQFLPSIFSSIRVFSNELALHIRCPKDWNFSISIWSLFITSSRPSALQNVSSGISETLSKPRWPLQPHFAHLSYLESSVSDLKDF